MHCSLEVEVLLIISVLICSGVQETIDLSSDVIVSAGIFHENQTETVTCTIDFTKLTSQKCSATFSPVDKIGIEITKNGTTRTLCDFDSFKSCDLLHTSPFALQCGCYNDSKNTYVVNVTVRANKNDHENAWFECKPNCKNSTGYYSLINYYDGIPIKFEEIVTDDPKTCDSACIGGSTAGAVCVTAAIAGGAYAGVRKYNSTKRESSPNKKKESDKDKEKQENNAPDSEVPG